MTNFIWGLIVGIGVAVIAYLVWPKPQLNKEKFNGVRPRLDNDVSNRINEDEMKKNENLAKLRDFVAGDSDGKLDNEDVRKLLGVSDATAVRYLDQLEEEGLIKQVGTDGPKVHYIKNQ